MVLDAATRKTMISDQIAALCTANNLELAEDAALLDEVTGLAEWPVALLGAMDADFLSLPAEVIQLSMAKHQKYFTVRDPKTGKVAPHFIVIANLQAPDGGKAIAQGNARVLSARLADARYFWDTDLKTPLEARVEKLRDVVFHQKLGSVYDKMERVAVLAVDLSPFVGADGGLASRAAKLAKADLTSEMVVEFTSLQGVMGRYYALESGEDAAVADAIRDHYKPQGPSDSVPTDPVSVAVALADKLDTLVGFWAINEKPTGSKDPYALRRAALGVIRLVLENGVKLPLKKAAQLANFQVGDAFADVNELTRFFHDRLKVYLRDSGARHDLIDAVLTPEQDDLVSITDRVKALGEFLETPDGEQLLAGAKRASNILRIEEKKDGKAVSGEVDKKLLIEPAETALYTTLTLARGDNPGGWGASGSLEGYMMDLQALSALRKPIDLFFENVLVNDSNDAIRVNRLRLLSEIRCALQPIADFDKIAG